MERMENSSNLSSEKCPSSGRPLKIQVLCSGISFLQTWGLIWLDLLFYFLTRVLSLSFNRKTILLLRAGVRQVHWYQLKAYKSNLARVTLETFKRKKYGENEKRESGEREWKGRGRGRGRGKEISALNLAWSFAQSEKWGDLCHPAGLEGEMEALRGDCPVTLHYKLFGELETDEKPAWDSILRTTPPHEFFWLAVACANLHPYIHTHFFS